MQPALTDPEWDVFELIARGFTPSRIAGELNISPSYVSVLLSQLRKKGAIRRRDHYPPGATVDLRYSYEEPVSGVAPTYKPALPPDAKLRAAYCVETQRDHHIRPIRLVLWRGWSVQGVPMLRPDGLPPKTALPQHRLVHIEYVDTGLEVQLKASRYEPWRESQTENYPHLRDWAVTPELLIAITQVIACAIGVEALHDVTITRGNAP